MAKGGDHEKEPLLDTSKPRVATPSNPTAAVPMPQQQIQMVTSMPQQISPMNSVGILNPQMPMYAYAPVRTNGFY
jgi:hypothetical protein